MSSQAKLSQRSKYIFGSYSKWFVYYWFAFGEGTLPLHHLTSHSTPTKSYILQPLPPPSYQLSITVKSIPAIAPQKRRRGKAEKMAGEYQEMAASTSPCYPASTSDTTPSHR
jgi:hypothetical protein